MTPTIAWILPATKMKQNPHYAFQQYHLMKPFILIQQKLKRILRLCNLKYQGFHFMILQKSPCSSSVITCPSTCQGYTRLLAFFYPSTIIGACCKIGDGKNGITGIVSMPSNLLSIPRLVELVFQSQVPRMHHFVQELYYQGPLLLTQPLRLSSKLTPEHPVVGEGNS